MIARVAKISAERLPRWRRYNSIALSYCGERITSHVGKNCMDREIFADFPEHRTSGVNILDESNFMCKR